MTATAPAVQIDGNLATVTFQTFGLDAYAQFLVCKSLPESQTEYDWQTDSYRVITPARFAAQLGHPSLCPRGELLPLSDHLFDYQRWAVQMALDARRFAIWADTGLGKGPMLLEWSRQVMTMTGGKVLILSPLAVIPQLQQESVKFYGDALPIQPLKSRDDLIAWCHAPGSGAAITNYEKFIPRKGQPETITELKRLAGIVCDESSILRTGGGKIKWAVIKSARGIEYKLSCTATPAPNEAMEYASQAAFLEKITNEGEVLWTWFERDKYGNWDVKPHAREAFYRYMASWSLYLRNPVTFGFGDILASLPEPEIVEERIPITDEQREAMTAVLVEHGAGMFADDRLGVTARIKLAQIARGFVYEGSSKSKAKRMARRIASLKPRRVAEIARDELESGYGPVLVWTTFDEEAVILADEMETVSGCFSIGILDGRMTDEARLAMLDRFRDGRIACLISKPQLLGYGLNLQFVKSMIFSGFDDSFERTYQAVRRAYRFGQTETVRVFFPYVPELEGLVFSNIRQKEARFLAEVAAQEAHYRDVLMTDRALHGQASETEIKMGDNA